MNKRQKIVQQQFINNEQAVIKRLKQVYGQALKDIDENINDLMSRSDPNAQNVVYQVEYQKAIKNQISGILDTMNAQQFTTVSDYLTTCYDDGFIGTMYDLQGQGIPLIMPINQEQLVHAVQLDSKINGGMYKAFGEDTKMLKKHITAQVSRGIATGMSYEQVAKQISLKMIGTKYKPGGALAHAMTIARTEGHRIQCQAGYDALFKAKEKGADIVKQWDSTLDGKTRPSHQAVDGEIKELDEKFSNGLRFPGDPHGKAEEVCNCRCALLQRARWAAMKETTYQKWNNQDGEYIQCSGYADFKAKYLNKCEYLTHQPKTATMTIAFKPAQTIQEARIYLKQTLGIDTSLMYEKVNLDVANMINKELTNIYRTFGNLHEMGVLDEIFIGTGKQSYYAAYNPTCKMMILNKKNVSSKSSIVNMSKTAKTQKSVGFWSTSDAEHSIRHEVGHAVDHAYVRNKGIINNPKADEITILHSKIENDCGITRWSVADTDENLKKAGERLSYYALKDDKEFVAESIAEYMTGNPREVSKKVVDILLRGV